MRKYMEQVIMNRAFACQATADKECELLAGLYGDLRFGAYDGHACLIGDGSTLRKNGAWGSHVFIRCFRSWIMLYCMELLVFFFASS